MLYQQRVSEGKKIDIGAFFLSRSFDSVKCQSFGLIELNHTAHIKQQNVSFAVGK